MSLDNFFLLRCSAEPVDRAEIDDLDVVVLGVDGDDDVVDAGNGYNDDRTVLYAILMS